MVMKIKPSTFSGAASIHRPRDGLAAALQGLAQDNARIRIQISDVKDFIDNSTGTPGAGLKQITTPKTIILASAANCAQLAALNTALGKLHNAYGVVVGGINQARAILGLIALTAPGSTVVTAYTIPALDKTVAVSTGTAAASYASARQAIGRAKANFRNIASAAEEVIYALGRAELLNAITGPHTPSTTLTLLNASAAVVGGNAALKTEVDDALTTLADDVATLASKWNACMTQGVGGLEPLSVIASPR